MLLIYKCNKKGEKDEDKETNRKIADCIIRARRFSKSNAGKKRLPARY
jgi:hypothetical protein